MLLKLDRLLSNLQDHYLTLVGSIFLPVNILTAWCANKFAIDIPCLGSALLVCAIVAYLVAGWTRRVLELCIAVFALIAV